MKQPGEYVQEFTEFDCMDCGASVDVKSVRCGACVTTRTGALGDVIDAVLYANGLQLARGPQVLPISDADREAVYAAIAKKWSGQ